jgi:hypothetical protein
MLVQMDKVLRGVLVQEDRRRQWYGFQHWRQALMGVGRQREQTVKVAVLSWRRAIKVRTVLN